MALALVYSRANIGIEAPLVTVEVHLSNGLPGFNIVGLPETAVKESKERVRSAILNSQLEFPQRRITINLAPADLPKAGGRFDLAIAVGILAASRQIDRASLKNRVFMGELALSGAFRKVNGIELEVISRNYDLHKKFTAAVKAAGPVARSEFSHLVTYLFFHAIKTMHSKKFWNVHVFCVYRVENDC